MLKIRQAKPEDTRQIKELITDIMKNEFSTVTTVYPENDIENPAKYYGGNKDIFLVAEEDSQIVGTVAIKEDTSFTALLRRLFVKKEFRGKGFGSKLIKEALNFCRKHHYKKVLFRGTDIMETALKVCLKNGFKEKNVITLPHFKMFVLEKKL